MAQGTSKTHLRVLRETKLPAEEYKRASAIMLVRVVNRMKSAITELVTAHGLNLTQFDVLMNLRAGEGITQQELSERLLLTKGNICITLQKMEADHLVTRRVDPTDERCLRLYLTDLGRQKIAEMGPEHQQSIQKIFGKMPVSDQQHLYEQLCRLDQNLDDMGSS